MSPRWAGFAGFKTAAGEELPDAVTVMDPFHVVRLAGDALDQCRRRIQRDSLGRRGRKDDPLYKARRTLHTGADLLTERQRARLEELFANDQHAQVEATWGIYQKMVTAYREPDPGLGKFVMQSVIDSLTSGVPTVLVELRRLGRTLKQRAGDVLAFFDRPGTSNGPTKATGGRLEHLRGSALGLAEPHQLHHTLTTRHRRIQTPPTPPFAMSQKTPLSEKHYAFQARRAPRPFSRQHPRLPQS